MPQHDAKSPVIEAPTTPDRLTQPSPHGDGASAAVAVASASDVKAKKKRSGFSAVKRSVTKGPRMLGRRIKHFLRDELYMDVHFKKAPPKDATRELATLELLAIYHRWLRGVQALLSIIVFLLSLMSITGSATFVNWTIFIISQAAILVICKVYQIKAQFSGVTNVLFADRNIFTSPYFFHMAVEVVLWNIQTPPIVVFWRPFFELLNYQIFIRLYGVLLYLNNAAYVYRTFCRAIAAVSDLPLSTSFLIRTSLVYHRYRVGAIFIITSWLTVGFMYCKAESVAVSTGMWFSFQTLTTLGYGDVTPITVSGRAVVILAGLCSFFIVAYLVVVAQATLLATDAEHNMQVLARCHDLTSAMRSRSAWVIQVAWRLHRARRDAGETPTFKQKARVILLSAALTHVIAALRRSRQGLRAALRDFRESGVNPLTGLSAYQYSTYVYETHRAARRLQRVKDVDRVYLALKDRDVAASMLTRKDIESIIMPAGLDEDVGAFSGHQPFLRRSSSTTFAAANQLSPTLPVALSAPVDVKQWQLQMEKLEEKCAQLSAALDAMAAVAVTHPPSMAVSQM